MAYVAENKKFVELSGMRAFYDHKANTIKLISTDEDLVGKPFSITLNQGTETEATLRELLEDSGVIREKESDAKDSFYGVPKFVPAPESSHEAYYRTQAVQVEKDCQGELTEDINVDKEQLDILLNTSNMLPLGIARAGRLIKHDFLEDPNLLVVGTKGSGISMVYSSILKFMKTQNKSFQAFDLSYSPLKNTNSMYMTITKVKADLEALLAHFENNEHFGGTVTPEFVIIKGLYSVGNRPQEKHVFGEMRNLIKKILKLSKEFNFNIILITNEDKFKERVTNDVLEYFPRAVLVGDSSEEVLSKLCLVSKTQRRNVKGSGRYVTPFEDSPFQSFYHS